jgi:pyruvate dehydrogenase E2 component (dihydrolipoamide acetyltransferase)
MPSLGADMEAGTVVEWLVKPGDPIKRGDIIAIVDTEKATIEVEAWETGTLEQVLVPVGEKVPVGTVLALIQGAAAEAAQARPPAQARPEVVPAPKPPVVTAPPPPPLLAPKPPRGRPPAGAPRLRISPLAKRIAQELAVDVSKVQGTGPDGAITRADVERAAKAPAPKAPTAPPQAVAPAAAEAPKPAERVRPAIAPQERQAMMRRAIAAAMARSKREIPHYYLAAHIDMSRAMGWLQSENLKRPVANRLLYSVLLLKAVALAIREFPEMNGFCTDGVFRPSDAVHIGVAISLREGGLIAPAIHDVNRKSLEEVMDSLRALVKRVRAGVLRSSEIADATITITSLGEEGVETVFGIIYPPQVALVGFGKIIEQPWAMNGMVGARPVIKATLSADHRASDGHRGALFLAKIDRLLQTPEKL